MRIVAIETSGRHGSLSAHTGDGDDARLLRQIVLTGEQRTAQSLAPALNELLTEVGWSPKSVELVAVTEGPGSFTGLRIGITTAKTFAYAVGASIVGVNTLAVLAAQAPAANGTLWSVLDAQRRELFVAQLSEQQRLELPCECEVSILGEDTWLERLKAGDLVIGPALRRLSTRLPEGVSAADEALWQPMAATVGQVAWRAFKRGKRDDVWHLSPQYYRQSAAEEKLK
jgi:tRNA threonylcarbamoyladenosine biosynthesis protein TsaB